MEKTKFNIFFRKILNKKNQKKLKNKTFSLIANNCNGTFLYHDLGIKYYSPFINLSLNTEDFIKYLKNISHYMNSELTFLKEKEYSFPVGILDDIKINFVHYATEELAKEKWNERTKRLNLDNIFILLTVDSDCDEKLLKDFDALPFKNKIIFTNSPTLKSSSAFYIKDFIMEGSAPHGFYKFINRFSGKRYYDQFDYIKWFNNELY